MGRRRTLFNSSWDCSETLEGIRGEWIRPSLLNRDVQQLGRLLTSRFQAVRISVMVSTGEYLGLPTVVTVPITGMAGQYKVRVPVIVPSLDDSVGLSQIVTTGRTPENVIMKLESIATFHLSHYHPCPDRFFKEFDKKKMSHLLDRIQANLTFRIEASRIEVIYRNH